MERLWAPWRIKYVESVDQTDEGCIFCTKPAADRDRENLILHRGTHCFIICNLYPYNNGHLMVVPYDHLCRIEEITEETAAEMWRYAAAATRILRENLRAEGFNIGINQGRLAGAGIDQHVHLHVVPRWNGDTNFMPVVGEVKVISQGIRDTYDQLRPAFASLV